LTRLTFEGLNASPQWTPDGKRIVFASARNGAANLNWKSADGSGAEERLTTSRFNQLEEVKEQGPRHGAAVTRAQNSDLEPEVHRGW
jgi:Tol biopolymer transport system component